VVWGGGTWANVQVVPPAAEEGIVTVAASDSHILALTAGGSVVGWGDNAHNQTVIPQEARSGVVAIATGGHHCLALRQTGRGVVTWGQADQGLASVPPAVAQAAATTEGDPAAAEVVTMVAACDMVSLALLQDAAPPSDTNKAAGGRVVAWGQPGHPALSVPLEAQRGVETIACGAGSSAAILSGSRRLVVWGDNTYGQLRVPPAAAAGGVVAVAAGGGHLVALLGNRSLVAWGSNSHGQTDVPQAAQGHVVAIAAGATHSLALLDDGSALGWGSNSAGESSIPSGLWDSDLRWLSLAGGNKFSVALVAYDPSNSTNGVGDGGGGGGDGGGSGDGGGGDGGACSAMCMCGRCRPRRHTS
jgi:alpha-tubulin suppressor-like RCC1 family protein